MMNGHTHGGAYGDVVLHGSLELTWHPRARLAVLRVLSETNLSGEHAQALVGALGRWIGASAAPFAVLADVKGVSGTDADYRATTARFFREHRDKAFIALFHLGPLIGMVAETFRIGIGLRLRAFPDEDAARAWLREQGIAA
jgi:hypothetical protein